MPDLTSRAGEERGSDRVAVNGVDHDIGAAADLPLLSWLREVVGLTGTKYGCGESACGACSVLIDGALARACAVATRDVAGRSVTTIEGLSRNDTLRSVQQAFLDVGAMQCGYCTPGMILQSVALLRRHPMPSEAEIKQRMEGNICRCGAYNRIVAAVQQAAHSIAAEAKNEHHA